MVARTPPKRTAKVAPLPLNPLLLRETVKKVDRCMARLQELQYVVKGGNKVVSGVRLSPKSTRSYLKTSLGCKQEAFRNGKGGAQTISPTGKYEGGWKKMSLPAMLVGETVGEIIQASQFAREIVKSVSYITQTRAEDPKTPITKQRKHNRPRERLENSQLKSRRKREKQNGSVSFRSESCSPKLERVRSRINFKISPQKKNDIEVEKESSTHSADRISPRHKPWAKKVVLFPNPLFTSTSPTRQHPQKFCRITKSPIILRNKQIQRPHKFLIKSPAKAATPMFHVKVKKSPPKAISPIRSFTKKSPPRYKTSSSSPIRTAIAYTKGSPKASIARWTSPARLASCIKTLSPPPRLDATSKMSTASKLRRSLSPARLANRLMSPLKSRKRSVQTSIDDGLMMMPGSKQRSTTPMRFLIPRI